MDFFSTKTFLKYKQDCRDLIEPICYFGIEEKNIFLKKLWFPLRHKMLSTLLFCVRVMSGM